MTSLPMIDVRASFTPTAYECGQSAVPAQHPAGMDASMPGRIGDAFHWLFAKLIYLDIEQTDLDEMIVSASTIHAADATEVRFLTHWGLDHWKQIQAEFPEPITEAELFAPLPGGKWRITGHPDVVSITGTHARVLDYKTGRKPGDYLHQLRAYAYLLLVNDPSIDTVKVTQLDVRSSKVHTEQFTRADILEWAQYYADRLDDKQYRIGDHCSLCPRRGECPRLAEWIRQMVKVFMGDDKPQLPEDQGEWGAILKRAHEYYSQLEYHMKDFKKALKILLKKTGPLPLPTGGFFGVVEKPREVIDGAKAYEHIVNAVQLPPEEILQGAQMTKKAIQEMCKKVTLSSDEKTSRTKAWKLENQLLGTLRDAGAVEQATSEYIEEIV